LKNLVVAFIMNNFLEPIGFDGMSTNSYHEQRPTQVKSIGDRYSIAPKVAKT
jgi:homogentisate 1,2-dioxygenase